MSQFVNNLHMILLNQFMERVKRLCHITHMIIMIILSHHKLIIKHVRV